MSDGFTERASAMFACKRKRNRTYLVSAVVTVAIAVFAFLSLSPAASSLSESAYCGSDAHQHSSGCYPSLLVCDIPANEVTGAVHRHSDTCYEIERVLQCAHSESLNSDGQLEPVETNAVVGELSAPGNEGADSADSSNIAAVSSSDNAHVHDDSCYQETQVLVCNHDVTESDKGAVHLHSGSCYSRILACELEEHAHVIACYSDSTADLELAADWEATLPGEEALTGVWAEDLIAVAESQLGYAESEKNYQVTAEGKIKGYSRYGAWYGDAYGDWCAMFVSFCLKYAGIPESAIPRDANCQNWIEALASVDYQMFYPVGAYAEEAKAALNEGLAECASLPSGVLDYYDPSEPFVPVPGDIVFFNWDSEYAADHVGIVVEVIEETDSESIKLKTIEGNASDMVKHCEYAIDDPLIMGYVALPVNVDGEPSVLVANAATVQGGITVGTSGIEDGTLFYQTNKKRYYQTSYHTVGGGMVYSFPLIPVEAGYSPSDLENYVFDPAAPEAWTASSDANFVVGYCVDKDTGVSTFGRAEFTAYALENSRIVDKDKQQGLAAIVANAYPFISAEEMRQRMAAAGVRDVEGCDESEMLAAAQQAIWITVNPSSVIYGEGYSSTSSSYTSICVNPIYVGDVDHKHGNHVNSITDYLINKVTHLEALEVESWTQDIRPTNDGLYDLTVDVVLKRSVDASESVIVSLSAGRSTTSSVSLSSGTLAFTLELKGVSAEDLSTSKAHIKVQGERMQAYLYDSVSYQDILGGNWENYANDLSFAVGLGETSVTATKEWGEGIPGASSVKIQLMANGVKNGTVVTLSQDNDWTYTWEKLPKYDPLGGEVSYTVVEESLGGYVSRVTESVVTECGREWRMLTEDEQLAAGEEYLLMFPGGAFSWTKGSTETLLGWERVILGNTTNPPETSLWVAEAGAKPGEVLLRNKAKDQCLSMKEGGTQLSLGEGNPVSIAYEGGYLKCGERFLIRLDTFGKGVTDASSGNALPLSVYKLVDSEKPASAVSYVITNYKADDTVDPVSASVEKAWAGGTDHPESVTVYLLQDGVRYGSPVTLSAENNWSYTWEGLPAKLAASESVISYAVEEEPVEGYTTSITTQDGNAYSYLITNAREVELGSISIKKVSSVDPSRTFAGAQFDLYCVDETSSPRPDLGIMESVSKTNDSVLISDASGMAYVNGVELGKTYYLVETRAPEGCSALPCPIQFEVGGSGSAPEIQIAADADGAAWAEVDSIDASVLIVANEEIFVLPDTGGGHGLLGLAACGVALIAFGVAGMVVRDRRR